MVDLSTKTVDEIAWKVCFARG